MVKDSGGMHSGTQPATSLTVRKRRTRTLRYALAGTALAMGAPLGWLLLRSLLGRLVGGEITLEISTHRVLYLYLALASAFAFAVFGAVVGWLSERLARANHRLAEMVVTDELTGLKNHRYFQERLGEECARAKREGRPLSLIMADLDHFKRVNDLHGHPVGDLVLAAAARHVLEGVRAGDSACRIGGEEFAVICPGTPQGEALRIAERIRARLAAAPILVGPEAIAITFSLGVAEHRPGMEPKKLFEAADDALYRAKRSGRNRVCSEAQLMPAAG
jgi:diguanylate cyclase (GGDEF)-like protein